MPVISVLCPSVMNQPASPKAAQDHVRSCATKRRAEQDIAKQCSDADLDVVESDVASLPLEIRDLRFDHVMTNPPYFPANAGTAASDKGREIANREDLPLIDWMDAAIRRLAPRGSLTTIIRTDRLAELLSAVSPRIGGVLVKPLSSRHGREAKRVIVQGTKGANSPLRLLAPLVLHDGAHHLSDADDHTAEAQGILRGGQGFLLV